MNDYFEKPEVLLIKKTVDAYPGLTAMEQYKLLLEERQTYTKEVIDAFFNHIKTPLRPAAGERK